MNDGEQFTHGAETAACVVIAATFVLGALLVVALWVAWGMG